MLSFIVPNHKHLMCGFFSEGCCNHLVHMGDRGWVTAGPTYELTLVCQIFIFAYVCFCVFLSLGFIYGAHFSVYTIWPVKIIHKVMMAALLTS